MLGNIRGYAYITNTDDILLIGYSEIDDPEGCADIKKSIIGPNRIIDIAVDGSALLCIERKARCLFQVDVKSVRQWFECEEINGMLIPPCGNDFTKRIYEYMIRVVEFNGEYDAYIRAAVLAKSFLEGRFDDSFLFK